MIIIGCERVVSLTRFLCNSPCSIFEKRVTSVTWSSIKYDLPSGTFQDLPSYDDTSGLVFF